MMQRRLISVNFHDDAISLIV